MIPMLIALSVFSGCSTRQIAESAVSAADDWQDGTPGALVRGEPEHLNAAVRYAASRHGLAVTSISDTDDGRVYELVSMRDEPGRVWVTGLGGLEADASGALLIRSRIGRFGSPAREREFEAAIGRRLAARSRD